LFSKIGRCLSGLGGQCQAHANGAQHLAVLPYRPGLARTKDKGMECPLVVALVAAGRPAWGRGRHGLAGGASPGQGARAGGCTFRGAAMIRYIARRLVYGIFILIGVNLLTFVLFFAVNTPDDMARLAIGGQRVSQGAIERWKAERGYDKPLFFNAEAQGAEQWTDTIFAARSVPLLRFDFGFSDEGRDIGHEIGERMGPSLALALPTFVLGLFVCVAFA